MIRDAPIVVIVPQQFRIQFLQCQHWLALSGRVSAVRAQTCRGAGVVWRDFPGGLFWTESMAILLSYLKVPLSWPELLRRTAYEAFWKDNCLAMAAQLAYYFFFALFP